MLLAVLSALSIASIARFAPLSSVRSMSATFGGLFSRLPASTAVLAFRLFAQYP